MSVLHAAIEALPGVDVRIERDMSPMTAPHEAFAMPPGIVTVCVGEGTLVERAAVLALLTNSLDAAWAEAEAALPEGWVIHRLMQIEGGEWSARIVGPGYAEWLANHTPDSPDRPVVQLCGSTPAAALRALVAELRRMAWRAIPYRGTWR